MHVSFLYNFTASNLSYENSSSSPPPTILELEQWKTEIIKMNSFNNLATYPLLCLGH